MQKLKLRTVTFTPFMDGGNVKEATPPVPGARAAAAGGPSPTPPTYEAGPTVLISLNWRTFIEHLGPKHRRHIGKGLVKTLRKILSTRTLDRGEYPAPGPGCVFIGADYMACSNNGEAGLMRVEKYICNGKYTYVYGPCVVPKGL